MAKFIVLDDFKNKVELPKRQTKGSAGYDIAAAEDITIPSIWGVIFNSLKEEDLGAVKTIDEVTSWVKEHKLFNLVSTGLTLECTEDEHLNIQPRSGLSNKGLLLIPNTPGLIDSDFQNFEIKVGLLNLSPFDIPIKKGERIAQAMFAKHITVENEEEVTKERTGGFGSTNEN